MNQMINQVTDFFWDLDKKQFNRLALGLIAGALLLLGGTIYLQFRRARFFKKEMTAINVNRTRIKEILEKNEQIKMQQKRAEEILAKDKQFKPKEYLEILLNKLQLMSNLKSSQLNTNDLEKLRAQGYEEVRIEFELININTKQLVDLLSELEKNDRIDIKKVEITKTKQQPTISAILIISTLQHKATTTEVFEVE
jgi:hypothetical protein